MSSTDTGGTAVCTPTIDALSRIEDEALEFLDDLYDRYVGYSEYWMSLFCLPSPKCEDTQDEQSQMHNAMMRIRDRFRSLITDVEANMGFAPSLVRQGKKLYERSFDGIISRNELVKAWLGRVHAQAAAESERRRAGQPGCEPPQLASEENDDDLSTDPTWTCKDLIGIAESWDMGGAGQKFRMHSDTFRKFRIGINEGSDSISMPGRGNGRSHKYSPRELSIMVRHALNRDTVHWRHCAAAWQSKIDGEAMRHGLNT